jgi:hypothetical protein
MLLTGIRGPTKKKKDSRSGAENNVHKMNINILLDYKGKKLNYQSYTKRSETNLKCQA